MSITVLDSGDIFDCGVDVAVVPVNCVGVPGKEAALAGAGVDVVVFAPQGKAKGSAR